MEVRPGYKQTEAGSLPVDWAVSSFDDVCRRLNAKAHQIQTLHYQRTGSLPVVDQGQKAIVGYTDRVEYKFICPDDGIIVFGDHTCIVKFVNFDFAVGADGTQLIATRPGECTRFHAYGLEHRGLASTGYNRHFKFLRERLFVKPPIHEQRAIATALSDVDALLTGLDRLIAKKRDLKQAAMQQLLTGQTRLPGFRGEWTETTFESLVRHHSGNSTLIKGKLASSDAAGLFPAYSASGQDVWHSSYEHEGDAIVVSAVGSRCGKAFQAKGKWSAIANTHVVWPNAAKVDIRFLARFLDNEDFWQKSGTGQPFVLFKKTFAQRLRLPPRDEQEAIATTLADMDAELRAVETRRDKTRSLKQGMMQELLTGRTRLV